MPRNVLLCVTFLVNMRSFYLPLALFSVSLGILDASVIRNVNSAEPPSHCTEPRSFACNELCGDMYTEIQGLGQFSSDMGTAFISRASKHDRSCLWRMRLPLRRSLWMSDCVYDRLVLLNQGDGTVPFETFTRIATRCSADPNPASDCQIQNWYVEVFEATVGRTVESLGLVQSSDTSFHWLPPVEIVHRIIDSERGKIRLTQSRK
jgi:hypothetical protein